MNDARQRGALGFAMRAGKCIAGDFACERAVKRGGACLIALDTEASSATKERYFGMPHASVNLADFEKADMGHAIGKAGRMVAAVTDERFAQMILGASAPGNHAN